MVLKAQLQVQEYLPERRRIPGLLLMPAGDRHVHLKDPSERGLNMAYDKEINVTGKACPMPLITLAREVRTLEKGQTVQITGNDPIFEESIVEFCREGCHEILETTREGRTISMAIKV
ncbi:MAG: sulfurtransferase TusA family protein [Proteobacteria bacterium]|nr:sulfurtransferase TusA family protein [Pseudomonadota bacterium]MBU1688550.1 sulfurtransferase TusA family protein [Pseudomonadota bacterium]